MQTGQVHIGPIKVRTDQATVGAFAAALAPGARAPERVPVTYPIRWLALPVVRDGLADFVKAPETAVLFHEAQTFDYVRPMKPETDYELTVSGRCTDASLVRVLVNGTVTDRSGETISCLSLKVIRQ